VILWHLVQEKEANTIVPAFYIGARNVEMLDAIRVSQVDAQTKVLPVENV